MTSGVPITVRTPNAVQFDRKISEKFSPINALNPARLIACGACSRLDPHPKLRFTIIIDDAMNRLSFNECSFCDMYRSKEYSERPWDEIKSEIDPKLFRPTDVTLQIPNTSKFEAETGWKPKYSFEESVEFLLNHCRTRVEAEKRLAH